MEGEVRNPIIKPVVLSISGHLKVCSIDERLYFEWLSLISCLKQKTNFLPVFSISLPARGSMFYELKKGKCGK